MNQIDTLILNLRYQNGLIGTMLYSGVLQIRDNIGMHGAVYGNQGTIEFCANKIKFIKGSGHQALVIEEYQSPDRDGSYLGEFLIFYEAIREGAKVVSSVEEAFKDMAIIAQALDSAESGQSIPL